MLGRGKLQKKIDIREIRPLTRADLEDLKTPREANVVKKLRDPHHRAARLVASGLRLNEVAVACGYSTSRIYSLSMDPAFQDLVAKYRVDVHAAYVSGEEEHYSMATEVNRKALRQLSEKLDQADEEGELLPTRELVAIFADTSDRVGISKKSTNLNINVDFAAKLESAIKRSGRGPAMIDVSPSSAPEQIRRRA